MATRPMTYAERKRRVEAIKSNDFRTLVEAAGLDPAVHFRFFDWRGVDLRGCNLRGYDFTGARLHGARIDSSTLIGPGPDQHGRDAPAARFDMAELGEVLLDQIVDPHQPGPMTPLANLRAAGDWAEWAKAENWRQASPPVEREWLQPGAVFQDAPFAPEVVVVPTGSFTMGSPRDEPGRPEIKDGVDREKQHPITIAQSFAVGRFAVTFEEYAAFVVATRQRRMPLSNWASALYDGGESRRPVIDVSWEDATAYASWLRDGTGKPYRLLSEAEWEYCCRAGTTTAYSFGATITEDEANFGARQTAEVGAYPANAWGLHDMHGNVREWCQDPWHEDYTSAPGDGSVWQYGDPLLRVQRGGGWNDNPQILRSAFRIWHSAENRLNIAGFRVARTINPRN